MTPALIVFGSLNMDVVLSVARLPRAGETVPANAIRHLPGGKGLNQATAAARAGAAVRMIGTVGEDAAGRSLEAFATDAGLGLDGIARDPALPTGTAIVTVEHGGENQIVVMAGANAATACPADLRDASVALAQLECPIPAVGAFLEAACAAGMRTILNAAPALAEARTLLPLTDLLVVNETELATLLGRKALPDALEALPALCRDLGCRDGIVLTRGAQGAVLLAGDDATLFPASPATVVDTTGAGDCFCGVLAATWARGADLRAAIARAGRAAALAVQREGAAVAMPRADEYDPADAAR